MMPRRPPYMSPPNPNMPTGSPLISFEHIKKALGKIISIFKRKS